MEKSVKNGTVISSHQEIVTVVVLCVSNTPVGQINRSLMRFVRRTEEGY